MGGRDPVIDGWPVGRVMDCNRDATCADLAAAATAGLARRDPGHPAIVTLTLHDEGRVVNEDGEQVLFTRSGSCCSVARFALADGTVRAIGIGYPGISREPSAIDYGP